MKITLIALTLAASAFAQLETKEFVRPGAEPVGIEKMLGGPHKGAPYSATMTMESVQTLADGNRITQKHSAFVARDSQGRMRQEISMTSLPGLSPERVPRIVMISDPVAQESFTLDLNAKTVGTRKLGPQPSITVPPSSDGKHELKIKAEKMEQTVRTAYAGKEKASTRQETLGMKVIEGVSVEGFRSTRTIPAGEIGNDKSIDIVSETWVSTDLKAVIYSKRSDPRTGDQILQLTNIQRAEPAASLFAVPADFTESKEFNNVIRMHANE